MERGERMKNKGKRVQVDAIMTKDLKSEHILYNQNAMPYHRVVAELVCRHVGDEASVLDIGCGVGHTLVDISRMKPAIMITACDIDPNCLEITGQRVSLHRKIHVASSDEIFNMPLKFDAVIMSHSLEHMRSPVDAVQKALNMVNSGGVLVLAVPNLGCSQGILFNLLRKRWVNRGHVCGWDRSHWMVFLEDILKLQVVCYAEDYCRFVVSNRLSRPIETFLVRLFPWFSESNIAVVRKEGV